MLIFVDYDFPMLAKWFLGFPLVMTAFVAALALLVWALTQLLHSKDEAGENKRRDASNEDKKA